MFRRPSRTLLPGIGVAIAVLAGVLIAGSFAASLIGFRSSGTETESQPRVALRILDGRKPAAPARRRTPPRPAPAAPAPSAPVDTGASRRDADVAAPATSRVERPPAARPPPPPAPPPPAAQSAQPAQTPPADPPPPPAVLQPLADGVSRTTDRLAETVRDATANLGEVVDPLSPPIGEVLTRVGGALGDVVAATGSALGRALGGRR